MSSLHFKDLKTLVCNEQNKEERYNKTRENALGEYLDYWCARDCKAPLSGDYNICLCGRHTSFRVMGDWGDVSVVVRDGVVSESNTPLER